MKQTIILALIIILNACHYRPKKKIRITWMFGCMNNRGNGYELMWGNIIKQDTLRCYSFTWDGVIPKPNSRAGEPVMGEGAVIMNHAPKEKELYPGLRKWVSKDVKEIYIMGPVEDHDHFRMGYAEYRKDCLSRYDMHNYF